MVGNPFVELRYVAIKNFNYGVVLVKKKAEQVMQPTDRGGFGSKVGFILATAGAAVGLGNLWMFPYMTGQNGGGFFFLLFLVFTIIFGLPLMVGEMTLGRHAQKDVVGSYQSINKKWGFAGIVAVLCPFVVMSYYSVVGGWILKYFFSYLTFQDFSQNHSEIFHNFSTATVEPIVWHLIFLTLCAIISCMGIEKGIEKANKIMLPSLFVLIFILAVYCMTLPGAMEGVKFFFLPDLSKYNSVWDIFPVILAAMGQAFFSLSIGQGEIITYGSYLKQKNDIQKDCLIVVGFDIFVAVMAGLIVLPACFSFGTPVNDGSGLIFETFPFIFSGIPGGEIVGMIFFLLVFFAAFSSAIASFEVVCTFLVDRFSMKRIHAAILGGIAMAIAGIFNSLALGDLDNINILGMNAFDFCGFVANKMLIPIGTFLTCIFIAYVWKLKGYYSELEQGAKKIYLKKTLTVFYKYVIPVVILFVFVIGMVSTFA